MPRFVAVSKDVHADRTWQSPANHGFAKSTALVPLAAAELPRAIMAFPVGFLRSDEGFLPAAILSLANGSNLYVTPDGHWLARYVPAILRAHPFRLVRNSQNPDKLVFCVDEESGLIDEAGTGQRFFEPDGNLAEPTRQIFELLSQHERARAATKAACHALEQHGVIAPWDITIKAEQGERRIEGVCKIDETALNQLPSESFEALRQVGALPLAYCQLISMQHLQTLGKLVEAHDRHARKTQQALQDTLPQSETGDIAIDWSMFSQQNR